MKKKTLREQIEHVIDMATDTTVMQMADWLTGNVREDIGDRVLSLDRKTQKKFINDFK